MKKYLFFFTIVHFLLRWSLYIEIFMVTSGGCHFCVGSKLLTYAQETVHTCNPVLQFEILSHRCSLFTIHSPRYIGAVWSYWWCQSNIPHCCYFPLKAFKKWLLFWNSRRLRWRFVFKTRHFLFCCIFDKVAVVFAVVLKQGVPTAQTGIPLISWYHDDVYKCASLCRSMQGRLFVVPLGKDYFIKVRVCLHM